MIEQEANEIKQRLIKLANQKVDLFSENCTFSNINLSTAEFNKWQVNLLNELKDNNKVASYYIDKARYLNRYLTCLLLKYPNSVNNSDFKITTDYLNEGFQLLNKYANYLKQKNTEVKTEPTISIPTSTQKDKLKVSTLPTTKIPKAQDNQPEVPLTPEQWGIKFTIAGASTAPKLGKKDPFSPLFEPNAKTPVLQNVFYMDLLPARQSTIPVQGGRDVPNAMPGLNYKLIPAVGKQQIPGFSPVYQNLGIKGMQVTIVGAFTGYDGGSENRKTDTPEPNAKSRFWSNAKGSPTLSDNPGRGNILSEATAYNSYTKFVEVCYQGKHMEVEINLFQVYQTSTATEIGEKVKLQSKTGNPKFTGVVRSLDVYHQTKERTWYTLVMDVTDFGMASKTPINLTNKLQTAIEAARNQLEQANKEAANPVNETRKDILSQIQNSNLSQKDRNKKKAILDGFVSLSNEAVKSQGFLNPNNTESIVRQITGKPKFSYIQTIPLIDKSVLVKVAIGCSFVGDLLGKYQAVRNFLNFTNVPVLNVLSAPTRFIQDLIGAAFFEPSISLAIESNNRSGFTCEKEHYFHLTKDENIIKEYLGNGNSKVTGPHYNEFPSPNTLSSLLGKKAQRLTPAEITRTIAESLGCVAVGTAADVAAGATIGVLGGGIPGSALGSVTFGVKGLLQSAAVCSAGVSTSLYQRYSTVNQPGDPNEDDVVKQLQASVDLGETLRTFGVNYALSLAVGGVIKASPRITKQGSTISGSAGSNPATQIVDSFLENLNKIPNIESKLRKQTITFGGKQGVIESLAKNADGTLTGNAVITYSNGQTAFINLKFADTLPDINLPTQPPVTSTVTNSPNPQQPQVTPPVNQTSRLTTEINKLTISDSIKLYLKSLDPAQQKKVITAIKVQQSNLNKSFTISRQGQLDLVVNPGDEFRINSTGFTIRKGSAIIDIPYSEVTGSKVITNTQQPPTQPPQNPVPQTQSTTPQNPGGSQQPVQTSTITPPVGLTGEAVKNFQTLTPLVGKQTSLFQRFVSPLKIKIKFISNDTQQISGQLLKIKKVIEIKEGNVTFELVTPHPRVINKGRTIEPQKTIKVNLDSFTIQ